jgi:hypothetical protein
MDKRSFLHVPGYDNNNSRIRGSCCSNYSLESRLDDNSNDKYTAAIELSNKCREFYKSRVEAANTMKSKWRENNQQRDNSDVHDQSFSSASSLSLSSGANDNERTINSKQQRIRVDQAMERLRTEMVSLMDQDLSLMKQLLTLNETIEELKWQSQYYNYSASSASFSASKNLSISDTEMYDSEDDSSTAQHASHNSVHAGHLNVWLTKRNIPKYSRDLQKTSVDSASGNLVNVHSPHTKITVTNKDTPLDKLPNYVYADTSPLVCPPETKYAPERHVTTIVHHERGENSFDSGIHGSASGDELPWRS